MKESMISLAVLAAISFGIAPAFAEVANEQANTVTNSDMLIADGMLQNRPSYRRVYKRCKKSTAKRFSTKRVAMTPSQKVVTVETTKTIEKPIVIQPEIKEQAAVQQPVLVNTTQPVVIDRYEKRHRSLIHLALFPIRLFGQ